MRLAKVPTIPKTDEIPHKDGRNVGRPQTKVGRPFFTTSETPSVADEAQRHEDTRPAAKSPKGSRVKVDRKTRLVAGGIPATKLAAAVAKVLADPLEEPTKASLMAYTRGIRLDNGLIEAIEGLTTKRGVPEWIRNAIQFVAERGVPPTRIKTEASCIASQRQGMASRTVVVPLGSLLLESVRELGRRARLTDKEVIEGCTGLYYKAHVQALEDGDGVKGEV